MKTALSSLILYSIVALNTIAQDTSQWGLPEGAKARFGRGIISDIKYSPDETRLAAASSIGVWLYDSTTGRRVALLRDGNSFSARRVAFSPDGRMLAVAAGEIIGIWDSMTGELRIKLRANFGLASHVAFSSNGRTIASGVYVYKLRAGSYRASHHGNCQIALHTRGGKTSNRSDRNRVRCRAFHFS